MLKMCLFKNVQKNEFHDLPTPDGSELIEGIKMKKILKFVPPRSLISSP